MNVKIIFYIIISIFFVVGGISVARKYNSRQYKPTDLSTDQESPKKDDVVVVYKKGRDVSLSPTSIHFQDIINEINNISINASPGYELIPDKSIIDRTKEKQYAIEVINAIPKQILIKNLTKPIVVNKIFIPLSGDGFPQDCIFFYEDQKSFPHVLITTMQSKNRLLKLIESVN